MPFCPKCRYEYRPEISICPDCNEYLVASLPEKNVKNSEDDNEQYDNWVKIGHLTSQAYANMINDGLHSKNIPVVIISGAGHFGQTGQMGTSSFFPVGGGYFVLVPDQFVEDANHEAEIILGDEWTASREEDTG